MSADRDVLAIAGDYCRAGLSVIPIGLGGDKRPALDEWKLFQARLPTAEELQGWFANGRRVGLAVIAGRVSGNLEILDGNQQVNLQTPFLPPQPRCYTVSPPPPPLPHDSARSSGWLESA